MTRVAAIDFETANNRPNSACQLGLVVLDDFKVIEERVWLIKPPELYFSPMCVRVHGITARDCMDAPTWSDIWAEVEQLIDGAVLLGHNVGFDARVLLATTNHYGLNVPSLDLLCSRIVAKKAWPALTGHGLANVAEHLSIQFKHHDALEDAKASATVVAQAAAQIEANSLADLEVSLGLIRGTIRPDIVKVPRSARLRKGSQLPGGETIGAAAKPSKVSVNAYLRNGLPASSADAHRRAIALSRQIIESAKEYQPLADKHVVLVHSILGLDHDDAICFLQELGATVYSKVNLKTQMVILGTPPGSLGTQTYLYDDLEPTMDFDATLESTREHIGGAERILEDVEKRKTLGQSIRVISQRQLLALIPSASGIVRGD